MDGMCVPERFLNQYVAGPIRDGAKLCLSGGKKGQVTGESVGETIILVVLKLLW